MKRLFALLSALTFLVPVAVFAQGPGERIETFDVTATVDAKRLLSVEESIAYDFGENERHGIYRDIPVVYERDGGTYRLRLTVDGVTRDGADEPYDVSSRDSSLRIKIGDPDRTISGEHHYVIRYHTDRAINFFNGEGELYWNVTGNEWPVPILHASFSLRGPSGSDSSQPKPVCYTGAFGSTEQACVISGPSSAFDASIKRPLSEEEGFTVVARFAKGVIAEPTMADRIWGLIRDNGILLLPVLTLGFMLWLWNKKGRDPKGRGTVIPQYDPPRGMNPAEMAGLKEQDVPQRAITATIIDLARRGYLQIDFGEEKGLFKKTQTYTFIKKKERDGTLNAAEVEVYDGLFASGDTVELDDLKGSFYKRIRPFKSATLDALKQKGLFEANPASVRGTYIGIAVAVGVAAFWIIGAFVNALTVGALVASAVIIAAVGWFMPRVTPDGAAAVEEVEGFKWFLSVTEKDRLAFHNAPEIKPSMFHAFLPAAIAFGVEEKWAEQFKGLNVPPPSYATGSALHHWTVYNFAHDIGRMNAAAAATAFVAPSSAGRGGSGFSGGGSGGGFGGGGGGSW